MLKEFKVPVIGKQPIPVTASTFKEAQEILQAYIDKRSLDWIIDNNV